VFWQFALELAVEMARISTVSVSITLAQSFKTFALLFGSGAVLAWVKGTSYRIMIIEGWLSKNVSNGAFAR
jgi:hypothetical protein